jgi:hypothetical protein
MGAPVQIYIVEARVMEQSNRTPACFDLIIAVLLGGAVGGRALAPMWFAASELDPGALANLMFYGAVFGALPGWFAGLLLKFRSSRRTTLQRLVPSVAGFVVSFVIGGVGSGWVISAYVHGLYGVAHS